MTPEDLVTVATFENTVETSVARGALEAAGIPAFVPRSSWSGLGTGSVP